MPEPNLLNLLPPSAPPGINPQSPTSRLATRLEHGSLVVCRALPHALVLLLVAAQPRAFSCTAYYCLALAGLCYSNYSNGRKVWRLLSGTASTRKPAAGVATKREEPAQAKARAD